MSDNKQHLTRRKFLQLAGSAPILATLPLSYTRAADAPDYDLKVMEADVRLAAAPFPKTKLWCFNATSPGPTLRLRQGQPTHIRVTNNIAENTGIHWHGLRIANEMDGIPFLTQPPIEPGESFDYRFTPPDAGTYWYHSHANSAIQVGRGIYGPLIIEEKEPIRVDRDLTWVLDDWRLDNNAQIDPNFANDRDFSRGGRIGNTVTLNGAQSNTLQVRAGERIRLRLINAANARIFSLRFQGHRPRIIALDGQPVEPFDPTGSAVTLAPAQRADLIIDMGGDPGDSFAVIDTFYPQSVYRLAEIRYSEDKPLRTSPLDSPIRLPANPVPRAQGEAAVTKEVLLEGGDLGRMRGAWLKNRQRGLSELLLVNKFWAICGVSAFRQVMPPFVTAQAGQHVEFDLKNHTAWPHTMHLHGHTFEILSHNGQPMEVGHQRDTVWLGPEEEARVRFVADNRGDWLFHCHMLSHTEAGMLATVRVV